MTRIEEAKALTRDEEAESPALSKETLEDLDTPEGASEEAKGGSGTRTGSAPCG